MLPGTVHSGPERNAGRHSSSPAATAATSTTTRPTTARLIFTDLRTPTTVLCACVSATPSQPTAPGPIALDLQSDPAELTAALVDIASVSGIEGPIADAIEAALRALPNYRGGAGREFVLARTNLGRPTRVLLAGHIDTVPIADNVPSRRDGDTLHGCGTTDMKSGDAMLLHLAATVPTVPAAT